MWKSIANGVLAFVIMFILTPPMAGIVSRPVIYATTPSQNDIMALHDCYSDNTGAIPSSALVYNGNYRLVPFDVGWRAYEHKVPATTLISFCYKVTNPTL